MCLSSEMKNLIKTAKAMRGNANTSREDYIRNLAICDTLELFVERVEELEDKLWDAEHKVDKLEDANYWREKHSGHGRGDSMG